MDWLVLFSTIFDVAWLSVLLWLLWRLTRITEKRAKIEATLADIAAKNAESAHIAVKTTQHMVEKLTEQEK